MLQSAQQADRLRSLRAAYASDALTLDRLEHTNVYNDAFCIGQEGSVFGTINGLRFGRTGLVDGQTITVSHSYKTFLYETHDDDPGRMDGSQCRLGSSTSFALHHRSQAQLYIRDVYLAPSRLFLKGGTNS